MKILKKAQQKNFVIKKEHYTTDYLNSLLREREIFYLDENMNICYDLVERFSDKEKNIEYRIFTSNLTEVKVILDEDGYYTTVAIGKNGIKFYVTLEN